MEWPSRTKRLLVTVNVVEALLLGDLFLMRDQHMMSQVVFAKCVGAALVAFLVILILMYLSNRLHAWVAKKNLQNRPE